eukprot:5214418-Pyramimonas_sp.AAC.1
MVPAVAILLSIVMSVLLETVDKRLALEKKQSGMPSHTWSVKTRCAQTTPRCSPGAPTRSKRI